MLKLKENETLEKPEPCVVPGRRFSYIEYQLMQQGVDYDVYDPFLDEFLTDLDIDPGEHLTYSKEYIDRGIEWYERHGMGYEPGCVVTTRIPAEIFRREVLRAYVDPIDPDILARHEILDRYAERNMPEELRREPHVSLW